MSGTKNVLIVLVGMTPAIVTETLWALAHQEGDPILIDRLVLITTTAGADEVRSKLLGRPPAARGALGRLIEALAAQGICIDPSIATLGHGLEVCVPARESGALADDAHEADDMESMGNLVLEKVSTFTRDDSTRVILSISGGRKTMSHLGGTAMSMLARRRDFMCHVLVWPPRLERAHDFYFPTGEVFTPMPPITGANNDPVHPDEVELQLADVPFIRLREFKEVKPLVSHLGRNGFAYAVAATGQAGGDQPRVALRLSWPQATAFIGEVDIAAFKAARGPSVLAYVALLARHGKWPSTPDDDQCLELLRTWREMEKLVDQNGRGGMAEFDPERWFERAVKFFDAVEDGPGALKELPEAALVSKDLFLARFRSPGHNTEKIAARRKHSTNAIHVLNAAIRQAAGPSHMIIRNAQGRYLSNPALECQEVRPTHRQTP